MESQAQTQQHAPAAVADAAPVDFLGHCLRGLSVPARSAVQQMLQFSGEVLTSLPPVDDGRSALGIGLVNHPDAPPRYALYDRDQLRGVLGEEGDATALALGSLLVVTLANAQEVALAFDCLLGTVADLHALAIRASLQGVDGAYELSQRVDEMLKVVNPAAPVQEAAPASA